MARNEVMSLNDSGSKTMSAPEVAAISTLPENPNNDRLLIIHEKTSVKDRSQLASHTTSPRLLGHKECHMMAMDAPYPRTSSQPRNQGNQ